MQPSTQNIITAESPQQIIFPYDSASSIASVKGKKVSLDKAISMKKNIDL